MVKEIMLLNLETYKEHLEGLKVEIKELKEEGKKIEKAKKYLEKLGTNYIQVEDEVKIDHEKIYILEEEIKLCKSIIRRYETLLATGSDEEVEE